MCSSDPGRLRPTVTPIEPKNDQEALALRFAAAMGQNPQDMYDLMAESFVRYGEETLWQPLSKKAYIGMSDNFLAPFPDMRWQVLDCVSDGPRVVLQVVETGTFTQPWILGDRTFQPNGKGYSMRGAVFMTIESAQIQQYTYIHAAGDFASAYAELFEAEEFASSYLDFLLTLEGTAG